MAEHRLEHDCVLLTFRSIPPRSEAKCICGWRYVAERRDEVQDAFDEHLRTAREDSPMPNHDSAREAAYLAWFKSSKEDVLGTTQEGEAFDAGWDAHASESVSEEAVKLAEIVRTTCDEWVRQNGVGGTSDWLLSRLLEPANATLKAARGDTDGASDG